MLLNSQLCCFLTEKTFSANNKGADPEAALINPSGHRLRTPLTYSFVNMLQLDIRKFDADPDLKQH